MYKDLRADINEFNRAQGLPSIQTQDKHQRRQKRAIGAVGGVIGSLAILGGLGNAITSAFTGHAPMSWTGEVIGAIFGIATHRDYRNLQKQLNDMSENVAVLQINDRELASAIYALDQRLLRMAGFILQVQTNNILAMTESDLRTEIRMYINTIEIALLKYMNIFNAAINGKVSPYAMSQTDLHQFAIETKLLHGIQISTNLNFVQMAIGFENGQLQMFFSVPIVDKTQKFSFFKVQPVPIFMDNKTYIPDIDATFIALSHENSDYAVLDASEYQRCTQTPDRCQVSAPLTPMSSNNHCVVKSYTTDRLACAVEETDRPPRPFIFTTGNKTIYSMPEKTTAFYKCEVSEDRHKLSDGQVDLVGTGEITFRPGCLVTLPDGSKWKILRQYMAEFKDGATFLNMLKNYAYDGLLKVKRAIEGIGNFDPTTFTFIAPPKEWPQFMQNLIDPFEGATFVTRWTLLVGGLLITVFAVLCCCPRTRLCCLRTCCSKHKSPPDESNDDRIEANREDLERVASEVRKVKGVLATVQRNIYGSARSLTDSFVPKRRRSESKIAAGSVSNLPLPTPPTPRTTSFINGHKKVSFDKYVVDDCIGCNPTAAEATPLMPMPVYGKPPMYPDPLLPM